MVNKSSTNAPYSAQLDAYKAAMWGGFAFGMVGAVLAAVFLRRVGIVGHRPEDDIDEELFPEQLAVEAGFALADPDDPRFIAAMKYRTHFGQVIHKAAVTFRDGNDGGEDHIDAVIGALKVNALKILFLREHRS